MEIVVSGTPVRDAAVWLAGQLRDAVRARNEATMAVSGGSTAPALFAALVDEDVPWASVAVWQVDERVAPDGDVRRNSLQLEALPATVREMPVIESDLRAAARRYAASLPERFDVVHLGVGDDGHTASWPPGNDAVPRSDERVEVVPQFRGIGRMTLTAEVVNAARRRLVLAHGVGKAAVIGRWSRGDATLPVGMIAESGTKVFLDPDAASRLPA